MANRYLIFGFDRYYPNGGINDCIGTINDLDEYNYFIETHKEKFDLYDIYDTLKGCAINTDTLKPYGE